MIACCAIADVETVPLSMQFWCSLNRTRAARCVWPTYTLLQSFVPHFTSYIPDRSKLSILSFVDLKLVFILLLLLYAMAKPLPWNTFLRRSVTFGKYVVPTYLSRSSFSRDNVVVSERRRVVSSDHAIQKTRAKTIFYRHSFDEINFLFEMCLTHWYAACTEHH